MKNQILQKMQQLLSSESQEERMQLQIELNNLIAAYRFEGFSIETELKTKNLLIQTVVDYVANQNPLTTDNLKIQLFFLRDL
ncbi:hypothetical protein [Flavobacterium sp. XGLA_31]|uniref:hypothetical protein n=1 Tax=Flavobacterium sp. XGLA_31 TaxID=3447666 RepID=UPI003F3BF803